MVEKTKQKIKLVIDALDRKDAKIKRLKKHNQRLIEEANRFKRQRDDQIEKTQEAREQYALFKENYKRLLHFYTEHQDYKKEIETDAT